MGMCGILSEFFASVFTDEETGELPEVKDMFNEQEGNRLNDVCITVEIVHSKLEKLALNKAPGVDGILSETLAANADILSEPLCQMYQASLYTGAVPEDWRWANVSAIFKKGMKPEAGNYRPVSLASHICKILESIIKNNVVDHVQKFRLIERSEHGLRGTYLV